MTTAVFPAPTFQVLPIGTLQESKLNPRKTFPKAGLEELAASLRTVGILQPLTVRPNGAGFEIGAGHRRYRAAKLAGLTEVPCVVKALSDVRKILDEVAPVPKPAAVQTTAEPAGKKKGKTVLDQVAEAAAEGAKARKKTAKGTAA